RHEGLHTRIARERAGVDNRVAETPVADLVVPLRVPVRTLIEEKDGGVDERDRDDRDERTVRSGSHARIIDQYNSTISDASRSKLNRFSTDDRRASTSAGARRGAASCSITRAASASTSPSGAVAPSAGSLTTSRMPPTSVLT